MEVLSLLVGLLRRLFRRTPPHAEVVRPHTEALLELHSLLGEALRGKMTLNRGGLSEAEFEARLAGLVDVRKAIKNVAHDSPFLRGLVPLVLRLDRKLKAPGADPRSEVRELQEAIDAELAKLRAAAA